jgi:arylsulfatase
MVMTTVPVIAADQKPNIVFIMGDDIGMWNIGAYHRGLMAGPTSSQASCRSALV